MPLALAAGAKALLITTGLAVVTAIGASGYAWWVSTSAEQEIQAKQQRIEELTTNRNEWRRSAWRWLEDTKRLREERDAAREAVTDLRQAREENDRKYQAAERIIESATPADDGPVAPVLRRTLEALP